MRSHSTAPTDPTAPPGSVPRDRAPAGTRGDGRRARAVALAGLSMALGGLALVRAIGDEELARKILAAGRGAGTGALTAHCRAASRKDADDARRRRWLVVPIDVLVARRLVDEAAFLPAGGSTLLAMVFVPAAYRLVGSIVR